ncbi:MAG: hypothetical protein ACR2HY_09965 [Acidimicrobiales bacterium]
MDRLANDLRNARGTMTPAEVSEVDRMAAEWRDGCRDYGLDPADPQVPATMLVTSKLMVGLIDNKLATRPDTRPDDVAASLWAAGESALVGLSLLETAHRDSKPLAATAKHARTRPPLVAVLCSLALLVGVQVVVAKAHRPPPTLRSVPAVTTAPTTGVAPPVSSPAASTQGNGVSGPSSPSPSAASSTASAVRTPPAAAGARSTGVSPAPASPAHAPASSDTQPPPPSAPADPLKAVTDVVGGVVKGLANTLGL